jgi:hypothetical protein
LASSESKIRVINNGRDTPFESRSSAISRFSVSVSKISANRNRVRISTFTEILFFSSYVQLELTWIYQQDGIETLNAAENEGMVLMLLPDVVGSHHQSGYFLS